MCATVHGTRFDGRVPCSCLHPKPLAFIDAVRYGEGCMSFGSLAGLGRAGLRPHCVAGCGWLLGCAVRRPPPPTPYHPPGLGPQSPQSGDPDGPTRLNQLPVRWAVLALQCVALIGSYYCYDNPTAIENPLMAHFHVNSNTTKTFNTNYNLLYSVYSFPNTVCVEGRGYGWLMQSLPRIVPICFVVSHCFLCPDPFHGWALPLC